jgi:hypothetical protein
MRIKLDKNPASPGSYYLAIVAIVFICVSWIAILLRFYVRIFRLRSLGKDDVTALLGQVSPNVDILMFILT